MAPMKAFFTGQEKPPSTRVATCQKCIRTIDIDDVGKDARHGSFFEMLGNFSFGDYFKKEVIPWAWEFLTVEMQIPAEKLLISVYEEDEEAYTLWHDVVGVPAEKIFKLDKSENFWEHGIGPCGPCSEIHYDRGVDSGCGSPNCTVGCDCDRFMEVWNLVFTQYEKLEDGGYAPLKTTNIDTGMGLERLAIVLQDAPSIFDIDNIKGICDEVKSITNITNPTQLQKISVNIIADHVRSVVFMAADGVLPSNEGRGYVLRRLLRRAVRHGRALGLSQFVSCIAKTAINAYSHAYPNLQEKSSHILQILEAEEGRFLETLDTGMSLLQKEIENISATNDAKVLDGAIAFKLYDTFGFPPDLTREILEDAGIDWDDAGFQQEMQEQKSRARAARGVSTYMGADETVYNKLEPNMHTEFVGYTSLNSTGKVLALICNNQIVTEANSDVVIVLDKTPFYAAGGGQKGDTGEIFSENCNITIEDCITVAGNNTVHIGKIVSGSLKVNDTVTATVDTVRRNKIACNHSATHLLQKALRDVLGPHVEQAGSEVTPDRLRFDFTHFSAISQEERHNVESLVNERIWANACIDITETTIDEARSAGATAIFGEKYGDTVRMVKMGDFSTELCGGTHVNSTQAIGMFKLVSESGIASGVRRIEAITGATALQVFRDNATMLENIIDITRARSSDVVAKVEALVTETKELRKEIAKVQSAATGEAQAKIAESIIKNAQDHKGFTLLTAKLDNYDIEALRNLCDKLKSEIKSGCMLLCAVNAEGVAQFLASATDDAVKAGIHAGNIVKEAAALCGGGGGGRPNHAQAGGKDATKVDDALTNALVTMKAML